MFENAYLEKVYAEVAARSAGEPEFLQAVREVLSSLAPVVNARPELISQGVMDCLVEPERTISFRVPWEDDQGTRNLMIRCGSTRQSMTPSLI